jgi:serine/threonine protein kinase
MAQIGDRLADKYRLVRSIGKGGMGEVFEAVHEDLNKRVAIKIPSAELLDDERNLERFKREPRVAAATGHRGIVDVYDIGNTAEGIPFVVMEYLEGESFADLIDRSGRVDVNFAIYVITQVLSALAAAHAKGIIHRDLKPENIFLVNTGQPFPDVKILDFGTSKVVAGTGDHAPRLTQSGTILGTPYYMAPEQIRAVKQLDKRLDIYAVGVTFYEAVTGQIPFDSDNVYTLVHMVLHDELIPPRVFNGDLHPFLEQVVIKAMSREREERFASAEDMIEALLPFMDDLTRMRVSIPERLRSAEPRQTESPSIRPPLAYRAEVGPARQVEDGFVLTPTLEVEAPDSQEPQLVLGRYVMIRELSSTGTETSVLGAYVEPEGTRIPVTIQVIQPHVLPDAVSVRGFIKNARLAAKVVHPSIIHVIDVGEHAGRYCLVEEYVHGYKLEAILDYLIETHRPMPLEHAVSVVIQVLLGLARLHEMKDDTGESLDLVHGHISPDSVVVAPRGGIKITNVASPPASSETSATNPERRSRSFAYMAPEQVDGEVIDHQADLFSVGVLLHELLAGSRLFHGLSDVAIRDRVSRADVPDILSVRPDLPLAISEVLSGVLVRDRTQRFANADAFATALRTAAGGISVDGEASFGAWIARIVAEPGFIARAGMLVDIQTALDAVPQIPAWLSSRPGLESAPSHEPVPSPVPSPKPEPRRDAAPDAPADASRGSSLRVMLALMVAVVLLAGASVAIALYALSNQDRDRGVSGRPVAMIITQQAREAGPAADEGPPDAGATDQVSITSDGRVDGGSDTEQPPEAGATVRPEDGNPRPPTELTGREVTHTLMRRQAQLLQCITRHGGGGHGGQIVAITVDINRDGSVASASVAPAEMNGTPLGQCVAGVARSIRFPRHTQSDAVFRIPIRLE